MPELKGKVAAVVGGARGIGRAYCEALLKKGVKVMPINNLGLIFKCQSVLLKKCLFY